MEIILETFNEKKLLNDNFDKVLIFMIFKDPRGHHILIHKEMWNKVGGFSEEFFPGTGSDPDLNMKLMEEKVLEFLKVSMILKYIILVLSLLENTKIIHQSKLNQVVEVQKFFY